MSMLISQQLEPMKFADEDTDRHSRPLFIIRISDVRNIREISHLCNLTHESNIARFIEISLLERYELSPVSHTYHDSTYGDAFYRTYLPIVKLDPDMGGGFV
jgi:hypothetical protein